MRKEVNKEAFDTCVRYLQESPDYSILEFMKQNNILKDMDDSGSNTKVSCPFHFEKTPSLIIKDDTKVFKCFSCNRSGGYLKFVKFVNELVLGNEIGIASILNNLLVTDAKMRMQTGFNSIFKDHTRTLQELKTFQRRKIGKLKAPEMRDLGDLYEWMQREGRTSLMDIKLAILNMQDNYGIIDMQRTMMGEAAVGVLNNTDLEGLDISSILEESGFSWGEE